MASIPIIGMGAVCAAGCNVPTAWKAVVDGSDGIAPFTVFETGLKQPPLCARIDASDSEIAGSDVSNRTLALSVNATAQALGALPKRDGLRVGLVFATTVAGMTRSELFLRELLSNPDHIINAQSELMFHEPTSLSGYLARKFSLNGFHTLSTACSTGLHAIGMAKRFVETGAYDLCLAVGADALSLLTIRGFSSLILLDANGCRPFDKRRAGISLGEGAGALLLASHPVVAKLGIPVQGFVSGWGASADGHHMSAPHPEGVGARRAVQAALAESGLQPDQIDAIAAHGTATPDNDVGEIRAMKAVFGAVPPFCSMKRTLGHTLAASGTLEAVFAVRALQEGTIPATGGFEELDDNIGIAPCGKKYATLRHILKNSFGFGGNNAAVVLSKEPI